MLNTYVYSKVVKGRKKIGIGLANNVCHTVSSLMLWVHDSLSVLGYVYDLWFWCLLRMVQVMLKVTVVGTFIMYQMENCSSITHTNSTLYFIYFSIIPIHM